MDGLSPVALGVAMLGIGGAVFVLIVLVLRAFPRLQPYTQAVPRPSPFVKLNDHGQAVLIVQSGGRIIYINDVGRSWFNLWEDEPNLERLARRARPSNTFLSLCAGEGQARLSLDGRFVEATSYFLPYNGSRALLVSLRSPQMLEGQNESGEIVQTEIAGQQVFQTFTELSQTIASSLDLEETLQAILQGVERLIPCEFLEITVWDSENEVLIPYRFQGLPGIERRLEKATVRYLSDADFSAYLVQNRKPLFIPDVENFHAIRRVVERNRFTATAYMGVPLMVAGDLVGTLELGALAKNSFNSNDLEVLSMIAGQAAVALHNALLYKAEQQRVLELTGLANLAQSVGAVRDPLDLFTYLTESIAPLLDVEVLGFLVYDENRRRLSSHAPFLGIPTDLISWYNTTIEPDSPAEKIWLSQETIVTENAVEDPRLIHLRLNDLAQVASIRSTVLTPLTAGGRMLGYLQAGTKRDGSHFDADDLRLLAIIAGQAGPIIENVTLVAESRRRAQRAETLRRIASLTGSTATLNEILKYSLQDLARLLQADMAMIWLLDEDLGALRLDIDAVFGFSPEEIGLFTRISTNDREYKQTATGSVQTLISNDVMAEKVLSVFQPFFERLNILSAIDVPLIVRERAIGELVMGSIQGDYFSRGDLQSASTAAAQLAAAIEQATLYSQTDQNLRQKVEQMTALTRISRELNSTLELEHLLQRVYDETLRTTGADCGSILLFELNSPAEKTNYPPRVALHLGDAPKNGLHPLEEIVLKRGEALIVEDFANLQGLDEWDESRPASPAHEGIRSALVVPIAYQDRVAGLMHLHAHAPQRFDDASRQIGEALAVQAAIALGNAHRYQELRSRSEQLNRRVETLSRLFETSQILQSEQPLEAALEAIAGAIRASTSFDIVLISVVEGEFGMLRRVAGAGIPPATMQELRARNQPWMAISQLLKPEYCLGQAYFLPAERMPVIPAEVHTVTLLSADTVGHDDAAWNPEDLLLVPLYDPLGKPLGLISVDGPRDGLRPDRPAIETLEIFASQATLAIESQYKVDHLRATVDKVESQLSTAQKSARAAQQHLPNLLHKDLEQTLAVQRLSQRTRRIISGLNIAETINRQSSREMILQVLGEELLNHFEIDVVILAEQGADGPRLVNTLGSLPSGVKPEALLGQRNPLRQVLQTGQMSYTTCIEEDPYWQNTPLLNAFGGHSFICLPIGSNQHIAAVLGISKSPSVYFEDQDLQVFHLLIKQVGIALHHLNLMDQAKRRLREVNLLMEFGRKLGSLEPASILTALVESAMNVVGSAHTALVAIWDPAEQVLVPQAAAGFVNPEPVLTMRLGPSEALLGAVFQSCEALQQAEVDFAKNYNFSADNLLKYRDATGGNLPVSSLVIPILGSTQSVPLGVLELENFKTVGVFTADDLALVTTLAQQTALTLENARLYLASEQRAGQLHALTRVTTTITSSLEINELIATLLDQLETIVPYETGTLWLREEGPQGRSDTLVVRAARGFNDVEERLGLKVAVEDSQLLHHMLIARLPLSVENILEDERFPPLMDYEYRSWLGLPLIASGDVIGVIALEKSEPAFYTPEHVDAAMTFAGQAAVGLDNAKLYQQSMQRAHELDQRSQRLAMLNRLSTELSGTLNATQLLMFVVRELYQALSCSSASAITFDSLGQASLQAEHPVLETEVGLPVPLPDAPLFDHLRASMGVFNTDDAAQESELAPLNELLLRHATRSLLVLPLVGGDELMGLLFVHNDTAYRYEPEEVELGRTIANQVSIALQNARLFEETRSLTQDLERRVTVRTAELEREHQRTEILLRIITELSASLDLDQVLHRTLEVLNEIVDAEQITVLIVREGDRRLHRLASVGYARPVNQENTVTSLRVDQGLAGWVIRNRQSALIDDVRLDERWVEVESISDEQHRSALAVPLMIGAEALGALLLYHRERAHFSLDHLDLVQAAANQVAVAVNNAELYRLIRDQAEDLGGMLRRQQIETSRSRAILEAVADGVLVTDANMKITLFNASAEKILGLDRNQVVGRSLEYFTGLFGRAAQSWMDTIYTWSQNPDTFQEGDTYAEQINIETGRVVSVHLAPVSMLNDFLGTVSIFQDITHQVEVDRLKSEFVATVSHELRTPMTSIKGYVEVLLMGAAGELGDQQRHFLEVVKTNTERLAVLVNDLLDISRLEAGRVTLNRQPLILEEIVDEAISDLRRRSETESKSVTIVKQVPPKLPRIIGDVDRVKQILSNLLENAYHYNTENGTITLRVSNVGDEIRVDVQDTGVGIPPDEQPRIFERFFRGEGPLVLGISGTGLGLSITHNLVEMHGGRIWLESSGSEGSTFSFTLPIYTTDH